MRRFGTLGTSDAAQRLAAALRKKDVAVDLRPEADGSIALWVVEEDHIDLARNELADFEANPNAERFAPAEPHETDAMNVTSPGDAQIRTRTADVRRPPADGRLAMLARLPVTFTLIGISVAVFLVMTLGGDTGNWLHSKLSIAPIGFDGDRVFWIPGLGLSDTFRGQFWRLVTPIFMHGGPLHLLFNMAWLWLLGGAIETVRGSFRLMLLVLATAVASNLMEFWFDLGFNFDTENGFENLTAFRPDPFFLGMSGVVFGLFGFVWMRARLVPRSQFAMPRDTVVWMLIWMLVCTAGLVGPIANVAHGMGLLVGMAVGAAPWLWRVRRSGRQ